MSGHGKGEGLRAGGRGVGWGEELQVLTRAPTWFTRLTAPATLMPPKLAPVVDPAAVLAPPLVAPADRAGCCAAPAAVVTGTTCCWVAGEAGTASVAASCAPTAAGTLRSV